MPHSVEDLAKTQVQIGQAERIPDQLELFAPSDEEVAEYFQGKDPESAPHQEEWAACPIRRRWILFREAQAYALGARQTNRDSSSAVINDGLRRVRRDGLRAQPRARSEVKRGGRQSDVDAG